MCLHLVGACIDLHIYDRIGANIAKKVDPEMGGEMEKKLEKIDAKADELQKKTNKVVSYISDFDKIVSYIFYHD